MMRFLVVDDEPDLRLILQLNLQRLGHEAATAASAEEAWEVLQSDRPDALLLDVSLPGESGLSLLARLREADLLPDQVAVLSAMLPATLARQAHGVRHLAKPFGLAELEALVEEMGT